MAITFPINCDSPAEKTEWLYRAQELLRLLHNAFGRWRREGLTQAQYDKFPQKIKNIFPYKPQLTDAEWQSFKENQFDPRQEKVVRAILTNRQLLKDSLQWDIKVEDI